VDSGLLALANPEAKLVPLSEGSAEETQADVCGWFMRLRDIGGDIVRVVAQDCLALDDSNDELAFLTRHGFAVEVIPGVLPETVYACRAASRGVSGTVG
jgi:siroheme synthase